MSHNSVLVDHEADSAWNKSKGLLDTVRFSDRPLGIAEEYEGELVFAGESLVGPLVVVTYSDDLSAEILEFLVRVSELASFRGASSREVFRIKIDDYVLVPTEVLEANILAIAGLESETRSQTTELYRRLDLSKTSIAL